MNDRMANLDFDVPPLPERKPQPEPVTSYSLSALAAIQGWVVDPNTGFLTFSTPT